MATLHPPETSPEIKILTPIGMLGYSYSGPLFWEAIENGVDAIIIDSGSTDSGPSKLALGSTSVSRESYKRDMGPLIEACHENGTKVLIGSAGGDGTDAHVDLLVDVVREIIQEKELRPMNVISIYANMSKDVIREAFKKGEVTPCSKAVPALEERDIDEPPTIVAQMGHEPWLKAMKDCPDFDVIIGGRSYDPAPYVAYCLLRGIDNLGVAYHMGKIMECGALCAIPKGREALATVRNDSFDVVPLDHSARCTHISVAAHTLYEKSRPDVLIGPGGELHLETATYMELPDRRTVRVKGAKFIPASTYTIKLEAARSCGYHSVFFGAFRDPILIGQMDKFLANLKKTIGSRIPFKFELNFRVYGVNGCMGELEPDKTTHPKEISILGQAKAETQAQATQIVNQSRIFCMHAPYQHQVATSGNFAMPISPLDIPMGQLTEFCMYHIMPVNDPLLHFPIKSEKIDGPNTHVIPDDRPKPMGADGVPHSPARAVTASSVTAMLHGNGSNDDDEEEYIYRPDPAKSQFLGGKPSTPNTLHLAEVASVIRSKNAGPYEITFDIMFPTPWIADAIKKTDILNPATIARLYRIEEDDVLACLWWDPAMAFKATIKRPMVSGGFAEIDTHGSAQHVPLMYLEVPESVISRSLPVPETNGDGVNGTNGESH